MFVFDDYRNRARSAGMESARSEVLAAEAENMERQEETEAIAKMKYGCC